MIIRVRCTALGASEQPRPGPDKKNVPTPVKNVKLVPVTADPTKSPENVAAFAGGAGGELNLSNLQQAAAEELVVGQEYLVNITPAPAITA